MAPTPPSAGPRQHGAATSQLCLADGSYPKRVRASAMSRALAKASAQVCLVETENATTAPEMTRPASAELLRRADTPTMATMSRQRPPLCRQQPPAGAAMTLPAHPASGARPRRRSYLVYFVNLLMYMGVTGMNRTQEPEGHGNEEGCGIVQDLMMLKGWSATLVMHPPSEHYQVSLACLHTVLGRRMGGPAEVRAMIGLARKTCIIGIRVVRFSLSLALTIVIPLVPIGAPFLPRSPQRLLDVGGSGIGSGTNGQTLTAALGRIILRQSHIDALDSLPVIWRGG